MLASEVFLVRRKSEGETVRKCRAFPIGGRLLAGKFKLWSRCSTSSAVLWVDASEVVAIRSNISRYVYLKSSVERR